MSEPYCNHDPAAVAAGVCECGEVVDPLTAELADMLSGDYMSTAEIASAMVTSVLNSLHDVASDYQRDTLDELAISAGLRWSCAACRWTNVPEDAKCGGCGRDRAGATYEEG